MRTNPLSLAAPLACASMIGACASSSPPAATPPRLALPPAAAEPCRLPVLPPEPTRADLETAYLERGEQLVACELARRLAVETFAAQQALDARWREAIRPRPWWRRR